MDKPSVDKKTLNEKFFQENASNITNRDRFGGKFIVVVDQKVDTLDNKIHELMENPKLKDEAYMTYIPPKNSIYPLHY